MKRINRLISLLLAAAIGFTSLFSGSVTANAASTNSAKVSAARIWDGTADTSWFTNDKDTYNISTAEQLAGLAQLVNRAAHGDRFRGVTINLTNDIILNDTTNWKKWKTDPPKNLWDPIGEEGSPVLGYRPFAGHFNGNGHTISGMYVNTSEYSGLFCYTSGAIIRNLKIEKSVVVSTNHSGALIGLSESSYVDCCEVRDVYIYSKQSAGGLIGEAKYINVVGPFLMTALMGFGILINPLIIAAGDNGESCGTYVNNSKAVNIKVSVENSWSNPPAGGIVGNASENCGVYNCLTVNGTFSSVDTINYGGTTHTGECGAILGSGNGVLKNCYTYNFKRADKNSARIDKASVKAVTKKTLYSQSFAKKMGDSFEYMKNSMPVLTAINTPSIDIVISGTKAYASWNAVKNAVKYKVYYKSNGKYKLYTTVTSPKVTINGSGAGKRFDLLIRAYYSDGSYKTINGGKFSLYT